MNLDKAAQALREKGYEAKVFDTRDEAADYLCAALRGKSVGFGGSQTLTEMNLRTRLAENGTVYVPDFPAPGEDFMSTMKQAVGAEVYILSANAMSEEGDIVNIDGIGNRLAGALFGHEKVYYVVGENKVGGTLEEAIFRARNVASPKNALRLHCKTPCALAVVERLEREFREETGTVGEIDQLEWQRFIEKLSPERLGTHCYDCKSPSRICASMSVHMRKPGSMDAEVVLIREKAGF